MEDDSYKSELIKYIEEQCNIKFTPLYNPEKIFEYENRDLVFSLSLDNGFLYLEDDGDLFKTTWPGDVCDFMRFIDYVDNYNYIDCDNYELSMVMSHFINSTNNINKYGLK